MAHRDLDQLLSFMVPLAQRMLAEQGVLTPFGGTIGMQGQINHVHGDGRSRALSHEETLEALVEGLKQMTATEDGHRAAGICLCVPAEHDDSSDAIKVHLEHQNGEAVAVFVPFRRGGDGQYVYGEMSAEPGERTLYVDGQ